VIWRRVPPVVSPIAARSVFDAGRAALLPRHVRPDALAADIARMFGADECILTDSGTSALVLALRMAVPTGELVSLPGYVCIDVTAAARRAGVRVMLYDIHPETLSPDLDSVSRTIAAGARAVVVAPLFGYPPDMRELLSLTASHGIPLIEDAAQAAGGRIQEKRLGAFGELSVLSFGRGKGTTAGAGGALLLRGPRTNTWASRARAQLRDARRGASQTVGLAAQWLLARPALYSIPASIPLLKLGEMVYRPAPEPRAISLAAAAVLPTAFSLDALEVRRRIEHATALAAATLPSRRFRAIRSTPDASPGYLRLAILQTDGPRRAEPRLGVMGGYPITLDEHPETQKLLVTDQPPIPGARVLRDRLITLPTHSRVSAGDVARLAEWLSSAVETRAYSVPTTEAV